MANRSLFFGLSPHVVRAIENALDRSSYPVGAMVYERGHPVKNLFFLLEGRVNLARVSANGRRAILRLVCRQQPFGLASVVRKQHYTEDAETPVDSTIARLPCDAFEVLRVTFAEFRDWIPCQLCFELEQSHRFTAMRNTALHLDNKIAWLIAELIDADQRRGRTKNLKLAIGQEDMADTYGVSHESISRAMQRLQANGLLESHRRLVQVPDLERLRAFAV